MEEYLRTTDIIDWDHPDVAALAATLRAESDPETAKACFEWVRDEIKHSWDYQLNPVTCSASDVLRAGSGYCFAKSHLLAALMRANGIPTGLCYQRLAIDDHATRFSLHGLNAVFPNDHGWYRVDPRGDKPGVDAQFTPPLEQLAWRLSQPGEIDLPGIYADPLPEIVAALRSAATWDTFASTIPDLQDIKSTALA